MLEVAWGRKLWPRPFYNCHGKMEFPFCGKRCLWYGKKLILENSGEKFHLERTMATWFWFLPSFCQGSQTSGKKWGGWGNQNQLITNKLWCLTSTWWGSKGISMPSLWRFHNYFCKSRGRPTHGQLPKLSRCCSIFLSIIQGTCHLCLWLEWERKGY